MADWWFGNYGCVGVFRHRGVRLSRGSDRWRTAILKPLSLTYVVVIIGTLVERKWIAAGAGAVAWFATGAIGAALDSRPSLDELPQPKSSGLPGSRTSDLAFDESLRLAKAVLSSCVVFSAVVFVLGTSSSLTWGSRALVTLLAGSLLAAASVLTVVRWSQIRHGHRIDPDVDDTGEDREVRSAGSELPPDHATISDRALWEVFKQQELGQLDFGEAGPGLVIDPPESLDPSGQQYATIWANICPLAERAFSSRKSYLEIDRDVWRELAEFNRDLPSGSHHTWQERSAQLEVIGAALWQVHCEAAPLVDRYQGRTRGARAVLKIIKYADALRACTQSLSAICDAVVGQSGVPISDRPGRFHAEGARHTRARTLADMALTELDEALYAVTHLDAGPESEGQKVPQDDVSQLLSNCDLVRTRDSIIQMHQMVQSEARLNGSDAYFAGEYVAAWEAFRDEPAPEKAQKLLAIAPSLLPFFERHAGNAGLRASGRRGSSGSTP